MSDINPYSPPQAELDSGAFQQGSAIDETAALAAFIGPRSAYYLAKWETLKNKNTSWNIAAFFLGVFWLAYRKMYANAFIFIGIIVAFNFFEALLHIPTQIGNIFGLVLAIMLGRYGNYLYKLHAQKKTSEVIRSKGLTESALSELKQQGGTQLAASIGIAVLFVALMGGIVVLFDSGASM